MSQPSATKSGRRLAEQNRHLDPEGGEGGGLKLAFRIQVVAEMKPYESKPGLQNEGGWGGGFEAFRRRRKF